MPDFLSNLLQRSGSSAVPASAAIFRPRLPALFEATGGTEGISAPPPAPAQADGFSPPVGSTVSRSDALPTVLLPAAAKPVSAVSPDAENHPAALLPAVPQPGAASERVFPISNDSRPDQARQSTRRGTKTQAGEAAIASQQTTDIASPPTENAGRKSLRGNISSGPIPVKAVRHTTGDSQSESATSRPAALPAALPEANELVVQIHIGRIEVRALTPPASPPVSQPASTGPTLSLDEYLRQREGKR